MKKILLGNTGLSVTKTSLGCLPLQRRSREDAVALLRAAYEGGVNFYDTANAWESGYHLDDLRQTAGVGIRWYSPIGPLRLEYGFVLDRKENESAGRFEFTLGMAF